MNAADVVTIAEHYRRVTELLEANNREVEARREAERALLSQHWPELHALDRFIDDGVTGGFVRRLAMSIERRDRRIAELEAQLQPELLEKIDGR